MAVAFHPLEEYLALESGGEVYVVAEKLASEFAAKAGLTAIRKIVHFPGKKLEYANFAHPFLDRAILGVLADYVTMDTGTGVVHTAPSHGAEDFATGVKYKLDLTTNVDESGFMHNGLPDYEGKKVFEANAPIIELLKKRGVLLHAEKLEHSYPHCWRCHNPIIFRATDQWFISMETPLQGGTLRSRTLEDIKKVKWDPAWGEERISNMIATRRGEPQSDRALCLRRRGLVVYARSRWACGWQQVRPVQRNKIQERNRHHRCLVRVRLELCRRPWPGTEPALPG